MPKIVYGKFRITQIFG